MSKCEKQVITKLNKKLEKYGLTREELELKLNSNEYCDVENCPHFDAETFNCTKKHHCDCDCPECSPESYG